MENFAHNLISIREEKGLSRQELANLASVSVAAIGYYENGHREPTLSTLKAIATALNVSIDKLLDFHVDEFEYYKNLVEELNIDNSGYNSKFPVKGFKVIENENSIYLMPIYTNDDKYEYHELKKGAFVGNKKAFCNFIKEMLLKEKKMIKWTINHTLMRELFMYTRAAKDFKHIFNVIFDTTAPDNK